MLQQEGLKLPSPRTVHVQGHLEFLQSHIISESSNIVEADAEDAEEGPVALMDMQ